MDKNVVMDGGEAILQACRDMDMDYIVSSPGSDWGSVWEALGRQKLAGVKGPKYLSCGHETLAVNIATGYTLMTGRMQCVLLHAGVGLMQGSVGIYGARLNELPMVIMSGESSSYGDAEGFDPGAQWYTNHNVMGGMPRVIDSVVKWAQEAPSSANIYEMVQRAGEIANSTPQGPTYLDVPIEIMMDRWVQPAKMRKTPPPAKVRPADEDVQNVLAMILAAKNPILTAGYSGRTVEGYNALVELCETLAIPCVEPAAGDATNFPKDHPLYQGTESGPLLKEADLLLVVRSRNPWYPPNMGPIHAKVVLIDESPFKLPMAYQNLQADAFLGGDTTASMKLLTAAAKAAKPDAAMLAARRARWSTAHDKLVQRLRTAEAEAKAKPGIHPIALCATLAECLPDNTIYLDETTVHGALNKRHVGHKGPQSFVSLRSGLGQGMGLSLGIKLARPDQPVVTMIGDGAFLYNPAVQCLGFARDEKLPIMVVIYNNNGYRAMRENQSSYYPEGAGVKHKLFYGEPITAFAFEELPKLFGGVGFKVDTLDALRTALRDGANAMKEGKCVVINVMLADMVGRG